jgi:hypothetical protein
MVKFRPYFESRYPRRERFIAILALANLILVLFDLSYLNLRSIYLQTIPALTRLYDPVKAIEPHPETNTYLAQVDNLETQIQSNGLQAPETERSLAELRSLSQQLLETNPFAAANQNDTFETIKQELRSRTGEPTSQAALEQFWSQDYLQTAGWKGELAFWNRQVRPLMELNYYRRVNRFGTPISYFWLIDLPFLLIFAGDIAARLWRMHRRFPKLGWYDIVLRRWFDLFLLLPFWRVLRVVPVTLRLYHSDLLNLQAARAELQRDAVISIAIELTEMIGIQLINQMQESIQQDDFIPGLLDPEIPQPHGRIIYRHEIDRIATHLFDVSVHRVLPEIRPDLNALMQHSFDSTISRLPGYQQLQRVPGLRHLSPLVTQKLTDSLLHLTYSTLPNSLNDPTGTKIVSRLRKNLRTTLENELQKQQYDREIQTTLINVLERIKQNYITTIAEIEGQQLIDRAEQLHKQVEEYRNFTPTVNQGWDK